MAAAPMVSGSTGNPSPITLPEEEERSTKKVKNKQIEVGSLNYNTISLMSFKNIVGSIEDVVMVETSSSKDIVVGNDDLMRGVKDNVTTITFSDRVHKEMEQAMDGTVMNSEVVGEFIKIDYNTVSSQRGHFARMAVKLDLRKPLIWRIFIDDQLRTIEYEGLPLCYKCARYGHVSNVCPFAAMNTTQIALAEASGTLVTKSNTDAITAGKIVSLISLPSDFDDAIGPWIHASCNVRRAKSRVSNSAEKNTANQGSPAVAWFVSQEKQR
ncbi:hypothetical protein Scep_021464 [Stephania cephalantha]|uniref:CCHC-type domain-containing protein n=1 Tax=Stephania cephalantha TaxID=152367 RepID=A0AAP0F3G5_9MAGN